MKTTTTKTWKVIATIFLAFMGLYIGAMMLEAYALAVAALLVTVFVSAVYLVAKSDLGRQPFHHRMGE